MSHFAKDFSRSIVRTLAKSGITIIGATTVLGKSGTYLDGERAYQLDDNGTHRVRTYAEVRALGGEPVNY